MRDSLLSVQDQEEAMSKVYALAVAAKAGYTTAISDFDRDGVDIRVQAGGGMRPAVDFQLKATINLGEPTNGKFRYPLAVKNYDLLRIDTQTPRALILLSLPEAHESWLDISVEELIIRRCAYWVSLNGFPETSNTSTVTIDIPEDNLLNVRSLQSLIEHSRQGGLP